MNIWRVIKITEIIIFLIACSVQDIKEKKLSVKMLAGFGTAFLISSFLPENIPLQQRIYNMLPGIAALLLAFLTKEQIGYGDGICLIIVGNVIHCNVLAGAVMIGLILLCGCSLILLIGKKVKWKTTLPFLPFLTIGILMQIVFGRS